jgi:ribonuclease P protein component
LLKTIKKRKIFQQIYKHGRKCFTKDLLAIYIDSKNQNYDALQKGVSQGEYAIIVSKKISNKAVSRNKIKRKTKEAIRINSGKFPEKSYILFFPKKSIEVLDFAELENQILYIYKTINKKMLNNQTAPN